MSKIIAIYREGYPFRDDYNYYYYEKWFSHEEIEFETEKDFKKWLSDRYKELKDSPDKSGHDAPDGYLFELIFAGSVKKKIR